MFIQDCWLHPIKIMIHLLEFFISNHIKSHNKPKLYFYALQSLNFIHANVYEWIFCFLKKFECVFIILFCPHFPHTKPLIEIVSCNFKTAPYTAANWGSEPLFLLIQNRDIKHFKNISRKIRSSHCFLYKRHISSIEKYSRASPVNYTNIDNEAFWDRGFEYPPVSFASRRVPLNPGPRTLIVYVCSLKGASKRHKNTSYTHKKER